MGRTSLVVVQGLEGRKGGKSLWVVGRWIAARTVKSLEKEISLLVFSEPSMVEWKVPFLCRELVNGRLSQLD